MLKAFGQKYQIFDVDATGEISKGTMVADYVWWDGKSKLAHPVDEVAQEALSRARAKQAAIDVLAVEKTINEIERRANERIKADPSVTKEQAMADELAQVDNSVKAMLERYGGEVPYSGRSVVGELIRGAERVGGVSQVLLPPNERLEGAEKVSYAEEGP